MPTSTEKKPSTSAREAALQAKIEAKIADLKVEALTEVEEDEAIVQANKDDWANRYRCKISEVSRRGAKHHVLYVTHPKDPKKPYRLEVKLGVWLDDGLPMSVIKRFQNSFDTDATDKEEHELTGSAGNEHRMFRTPRFAVQFDPKPIKTKEAS